MRRRAAAVFVGVLLIAALGGSSGRAQDEISPRNGSIVFSRYFRDGNTPAPDPIPLDTPYSFRLKPIPNFDTDLFLLHRNGRIEQLTARARTEDTYPEWSPDGSRLAFTRRVRKQDTELYVMRADGTHLLRLTDNKAWEREPTWSPDGKYLLFTRWTRQNYRTRLYVIPVRRIAKARQLTNGCSDHSPAWSPDGTRIAFSRSVLDGCSSGNDEIFVMDVDGSNIRRLTDNGTNDWNPTWSPGGDSLLFEHYECQVEESSPSMGCILGEDMELWMMGADGSDAIPLTDNTDDEYWPEWSPDGRWILFVRTPNDARWNPNLYKMKADGSAVERLTSGSGIDMHPDWQRRR